jgi:hypothetical protein
LQKSCDSLRTLHQNLRHSAFVLGNMHATSPPTGRRIVLELEREMEDGLYPLFYRTLAPAEYHVYLHPDDYRHVETIVPLIVGDAQRHLNDRVDQLNNKSPWALLGEKPSPIEVPPGGWAIFIHAAANNEVTRGELGIVSRLAIPVSASYEDGAPTVRIGRTVVTETVRRRSTADEPAAGTGSARALVGTQTEPVRFPFESTSRHGFATLSYIDEEGPHRFTMRKDTISIGRGGDAHWVDVQVVTTPRVSREHCRIRRAATGEFFIEDVSTWGTSVDGAQLARGSPDAWRLPSRARIDLAGALVIEFDAEAHR